MEKIWTAILNLRTAVASFKAPIQICWIHLESGEVLINKIPTQKTRGIFILCEEQSNTSELEATATFVLSKIGSVKRLNTRGIAPEELIFLKKYLPYCFLSIKAKQLNRAICITHFAQTLDAKIATSSGDSKWIGNEENLIHAHRMRALCDGVLVGSRTVEADNPRLNVRHVSGQNPTRIILGNPNSDLQSLIKSAKTPILVFGKEKKNTNTAIVTFQLSCCSAKKKLPPQIILKKLFEQKIYTVYVEGGATTTSNFLKAKAVDIVQLHIAPMIFGSGKTSIVLPNIDEVKEALNFSEFHFLPFGDSIMFTGWLQETV